MSIFSKVFNLHAGAVAAVTLGFLCGAGLALAMDATDEAVKVQEGAFFAACAEWYEDRTCSCALTQIEDRVGAERFVQASLRTDGVLFNDPRMSYMAIRAVEDCTRLAGPPTD